MRDRRPARFSTRWGWWNTFAWWLADRFQGRKVLGRVSYGEGGWFIDGGTVDLDAIRTQVDMDAVKMEITIYDPQESEEAPPQ